MAAGQGVTRWSRIRVTAASPTGARARVRRVRQGPAAGHDGFGPSADFFDALEQGVELDGAWLARAGLPLPRSVAETCFIAHLERL